MSKLRVAVATDIHYGFDQRDKLGSKAPALMEQFIKYTGKLKPHPDFVIDIGDRVNSRDADDDRKYMQELKSQYNKMAIPLHSVLGNHDIKNLSRADNEQIMGTPATSYSMDAGNYHFVFWNPDVGYSENGMTVTQADIDWLKKDLAATDKLTAFFCHMPLYISEDARAEQEREKGAQNIVSRFSLQEAPQLRNILSQSGKVCIAMGGHRHKNCYDLIDGVHYITQQSMTSEYKEKYSVPTGTWSLLEFDDEEIKIRLYGKARMRMDGKLRRVYTLETPKAGSMQPPPGDPQP